MFKRALLRVVSRVQRTIHSESSQLLFMTAGIPAMIGAIGAMFQLMGAMFEGSPFNPTFLFWSLGAAAAFAVGAFFSADPKTKYEAKVKDQIINGSNHLKVVNVIGDIKGILPGWSNYENVHLLDALTLGVWIIEQENLLALKKSEISKLENYSSSEDSKDYITSLKEARDVSEKSIEEAINELQEIFYYVHSFINETQSSDSETEHSASKPLLLGSEERSERLTDTAYLRKGMNAIKDLASTSERERNKL